MFHNFATNSDPVKQAKDELLYILNNHKTINHKTILRWIRINVVKILAKTEDRRF